MAKKRKKDKKQDEEYEFKPPEFDEREFLKKELRDTRAAIAAVGVAVLFGIVAGLITAFGSGLILVAFIIGMSGLVSLRYVYNMLGFDISGFTKKNWAGTAVTYFFTFLAIWVLLINTPFADLTDPSVEKLTIWVDNGTTIQGIEYKKIDKDTWVWTPMNETVDLNSLIHRLANQTINITARIADSGGISVAEIAIGATASTYSPMTKVSSGKYEYSITSGQIDGDSFMFFIHAEDKHGNERLFSSGSIPASL